MKSSDRAIVLVLLACSLALLAPGLLAPVLTIRGVLTGSQLLDAPRGKALAESLKARSVDLQEVPANEFASAAETESPQGVVAIAEVPERGFRDVADDWKGVVLVLDGVQDPGNVGTIVRTAAALGAVATVALPGTVDLWNAKVVRSGMGAHFRHLAFSSTWEELDAFRKSAGARLVAADAAGDALPRSAPAARLVLVVGNEGAGLSAEARTRADAHVALPMSRDVESLNVAVATGILLYALTQ